MQALLTEYLLKGVYLGLLAFVALQQPDLHAVGRVVGYTLVGLVLCLAVSAIAKFREGVRVQGMLPAFVLFLLLESPLLCYAGVIGGAVVGALAVRRDGDTTFVPLVLSGAGLGVAFFALRRVTHRWFRLGLSFGLAVALASGAITWIQQYGDVLDRPGEAFALGILLLSGIPFFYLLTFAGVAEETEVEIGAISAALGLALWLLTHGHLFFQATCFLLPLMLYFFYTMRVLPGLRVFKCVFRGIGSANVGRYRDALLAFQRALRLDPHHALARDCLWRLHRTVDLRELEKDPETLQLIDLDLCLDRIAALFATRPDAERAREGHHLLELVLRRRPEAKPIVEYWRAVAHVHDRRFDEAAACLHSVLESTDEQAHRVVLQAWNLALVLHPEMKKRVGEPQLRKPGQRMRAIAAVEARLAEDPGDPDAWGLKRLLYSELTEEEYVAEAPPDADFFDQRATTLFDHDYARQLGLALLDDANQRPRALAYLRIAARGLPHQAPSILQQAALACERAGDPEGRRRCLDLARRAGRHVGQANLDADNRAAYFAIVKLLGEEARDRGDLDVAIENFQLYAESERSGIETLRVLAQLHEDKQDALAALRVTERALLYNSGDKDFIARKDRYYYSVTPEQLRANLASIANGYDVDYCLRKARSILDMKDLDYDMLDWGQHLAECAAVVRPESVAVKVLRARALRRRGELEACRQLLEEARTTKPSFFASGIEEDAWFTACRLLGEIYLNDFDKPDLAIPCLLDFKNSAKSGADTLFKLGLAYERVGDLKRAANCFEQVTAYDGHPLVHDARDALRRVRG
jgi:tetratricopeptide (TPR) repeat protein